MTHDVELYDIYGLWHVPFWQTTWFSVVIGILSALVIMVLVYGMVTRYLSRRPATKPWVVALQELENLSKNIQPADSERFYTALTTLLKHYLYRRFGYSVLSKTDAQVTVYLKSVDLDPAFADTLETIFQGSIVCKFAHQQAIKEAMHRDLAAAIAFINATIPGKSTTKKDA